MITLAEYNINGLLYQDNRFALYRGIRVQDQKKVLLKICIRDEPTLDEITTLQHEYQMLSLLNVPNVIHVYDLIKQDGQLVLILEDIGGLTLKEYLKKQPISLTKFFKIALELVDAISMIHMQHIIHKNINPNSILINPTILTPKLYDFSISSQLTQESYESIELKNLEGTLAYLSPEQTGRMNRPIDYRSDFYSLGVTFYEMLTGTLPFHSDDPLEVIHQHLAKMPDLVTSLNHQIPEQIAKIIAKLLAKTPEDRYISSTGLKADILECRNQWQLHHQIDEFSLGQQDIYDYLTLSQKLYGRDEQIKKLLETFDRTCQGNTELLLVSGYSGIGKTSLVKELYKPITPQRGFLIKGKFDQLQRVTPYSAIIEAFKDLISRLLSESPEYLVKLKQSLLQALGNNGKIIIDVLPDVELIIGQQPAVVVLPPNEAQNRFRITLQNFIRSLAQKEHPLVLFLDDLQWIDNASLQLIESLLSDPDLHYFLLIGAYRDNEVSNAHPLTHTLLKIDKLGVKTNRISLTSLTKNDIQQLLSDSFNCELSKVESFADLLEMKTHGNPFFINQFLKVLYQKKLLIYFYEKRQWEWDISNIQLDSIAENIIDLLTFRLKQLSIETQNLLTLCACIGHMFDLQTLATISEQSITQTMQQLATAISLNLIIPLEGGYKSSAVIEIANTSDVHAPILRYQFLHDRIQQAAYNLIDDEKKQTVHHKIGKLLLGQKFLVETDPNLFEIVNHFIQSLSLIVEPEEKKEIAKYCLWAGKKAKASTAYHAAKNYLQAGNTLLQTVNWDDIVDLPFLIKRELAVCEYLTGEFEQAEMDFHLLISQTKNKADKIECYKLYCEMLATLNKHNEALKQGLTALSMVGIHLPNKPNLVYILWCIFRIKMQLGWKSANNVNLQTVGDPEHRVTIDLVSQMLNSAFIVNQNLFIVLTCTSVSLSLRYGYSDGTGFACIVYAFIIMHALHRYDEALEYVELYNRLSKWNLTPNSAGKSYFVASTFIDPYRYPIDVSIESITKAYRLSYEVGDLAYSNYCNVLITVTAFMAGKPLSVVEKYVRSALSFMDKIKTSDFHALSLFFYYSLQCLSNTELDVEQINKYEQEVINSKNITEKSFFYSHCTKLYYLLGDLKLTKEMGEKHENVAEYALGMVSVTVGKFYYSMAILASVQNKKSLTLKEWKIIKKTLRHVDILSKWCPVNFKHYSLLLRAELSRINNKSLETIELYNKAITSASEQEVMDMVAIANECASRYFMNAGLSDIAQVYIKNAHHYYQKCDAFIKCKFLEKQYPYLFQHLPVPMRFNERTEVGINADAIDALSILKLSQVFSSEIQLDKLLNKLLHILIENAGAQRGILMIKDNDKWFIEAEGTMSSQKVFLTKSQSIENIKYISFSLSLINHVQYKQDVLLIQNSEELIPFLEKDAYLQETKPESILILPIHFQNQLRYILYLENKSASHAFTPKHVSILQLLASQAAISLENAHLFYQASHDPLTGLPNRNLLYDQFNQEVMFAKQNNKLIAILFMDLDNFKKINDTLGHEIGDNILIHFAQQIIACLREGDLAARLGGDEFIIMMPNLENDTEVIDFINNLMKRLRQPAHIMNHEIYLSSSVGISMYPKDGADIQALLKQADITLYQVKSTGKNHYKFYTPHLSLKLKEEFAREIALRNAFEKKELCLSYQPIYTSHTHQLTHFEVLLRWPHPVEGLIQAKEFIPLAEKTGLIVPIGEWVLRAVCNQISTWKIQGLPIVPLAVNVSGLQFQYQTISDVVSRILQETDIDPALLELEFTESVFIDRSDKIRNDIAALRSLNIRLTIDDFGTYFSSLSYLKRLPIDTIKIDRSFVNDIHDDKESNAIITSIITMAHNLKLRVIAEGVETKQQLLFLEECGVDELQGYYLGVPVDKDACVRLLKKQVKEFKPQ